MKRFFDIKFCNRSEQNTYTQHYPTFICINDVVIMLMEGDCTDTIAALWLHCT